MDTAARDVKGSYLAGAWSSFTVPGHKQTVALPWYVTSNLTLYDGARFGAAGLDPAAPPVTFEQMWHDALVIKRKTGEYGMDAEVDGIANALARYGVQLVSDDGRRAVFNTPKAVEFLTRMRELYQQGAVNPDSVIGNQRDEIEDYTSGRIAIFPGGPNFLTIIKQNNASAYRTTRIGPQITQAGHPDISMMGLLVPRTSRHKATAMAFAKYMTNAQNQLAFCKVVTIFPSTTASLHDTYFTRPAGDSPEDVSRTVITRQLTDARPVLPMSTAASFADPLKAAYQSVLLGKKQPTAALAEAQTQATQALEEAK